MNVRALGFGIERDVSMHGTCYLLLSAIGLLLSPGGQTQFLTRAFCDDGAVEAAVGLALVTHNAKLQSGNQLALYQIVGALRVRGEPIPHPAPQCSFSGAPHVRPAWLTLNLLALSPFFPILNIISSKYCATF